MANIRLENIVKRFGRVVAVDDVSFEIKDGEFLTLVGPSGCGKTTLLRMIAGLEPVSSGGIFFDGRLSNHISPRNRNIAMVFQQYALYPNMTVRENLGFSLKLKNVPKQEREAEIKRVAGLLSIEPFLDRKPRELSGGQQQRVALGRALIRKPVVFLFDEPLSNLDAKLRISMREEIHNLHSQLKTTFVYVTHDQLEAMTLSDRIVVMYKGRVQQMGSPSLVYRHPANEFVAGFIGMMNFIDGCELVEEHHRLRVQGSLFSMEMSEEKADSIREKAKGRKVKVGIRPENITILPSVKEEDLQVIRAKVSFVEPIGPSSIVYAHADGQRIQTICSTDTEFNSGEAIYLKFQADHLHLFNHETGEALI